MKSQKLSNLFSLERRYHRSVNLERDVKSLEALQGYVLTQRSAEALERIIKAFADPDAHRAWTLTGVYGTGKSAFAHYISNLLASRQSKHYQAAVEITTEVFDDDHSIYETLENLIPRKGIFRAIATGQREPLHWTVLRALALGADLFWTRGKKPELLRQLTDWRVEINSGDCDVSGQQVLNLLSDIADKAQAPIFLIIDELGKNLEFAAQNLGKQDLYLLQQIAELRQSGDSQIYFLGLLHQTFEGYGERLTTVEKQEWNKIQGRFEDISFRELPSQMTRLIGRVIDRSQSEPIVAKVQSLAEKWANEIPDLYAEHEVSAEILGNAYPLHPLSALALPQLCLQYAQNDRSLFTFLTSDEPFSFKNFLSSNQASQRSLPTLKLYELYDYFVESVSGIASRFNLQRWVEIQSLIAEAKSQDEDVIKVLKSIGVLNLVSAAGMMRATPSLVALSLCDRPQDSKQLKHWQALIKQLREQGLITYRGALDELRLWQGSDFDVEQAIQTQVEQDRQSLASLLAVTHPLKPLVAQRHLLQTGTLRFFEQQYIDSSVTLDSLQCSESSHDGLIAYWMDVVEPIDIPERTVDGKPLILIWPENLDPLHIRARHLNALQKIQQDAPELGVDGVARREVKQRLIEAERLLDETLQQVFAWKSAQIQCWISGKQEIVPHVKAFNAQISDTCDLAYSECLELNNELINRRQLTSQGAKARRQLIEAMLESGDQERLGLTGYGPEVAIYYSVLENTNIHQLNNEQWEFGPPTVDSGVESVWSCIEEFCFQSRNEQRSLDQLYEQLAQAPYGVKQGVIPVLLAAVLLYHVDDVGIYKDGTFIPVLGPEHFELLVKDPSRFSVKYFEMVGLRSEVFKELEQILRSPNAKAPAGVRNASLLMVAKPLFSFVRTLNKFTLQTRRISDSAQNVIKVLQIAQEPDELLFESLPKACGLSSIAIDQEVDFEQAKKFRKRLVQSLHEIQTAYDSLLTDCQSLLHEAFGVRQKEENLREDLRVRSSYLVGQCIEPVLKRFLIAATDEKSSDQEWIQALVMIVADKPPKSWKDEDFTRYEIELSDLVRRFQNLEALHKEVQSRGQGFEAQRITATEPNGNEIHEVLWINETDKPLIDEIIKNVLESTKLKGDPKLQRAFVARLIKTVIQSELSPQVNEFSMNHNKRTRKRYG